MKNNYDFVIDLCKSLPDPPIPDEGSEPIFKTISTSEESPNSEEAGEFVGGYVELVRLKNGDQLLLNEEGRLKGMPLNKRASELYGGIIVGDVILLTGEARWT